MRLSILYCMLLPSVLYAAAIPRELEGVQENALEAREVSGADTSQQYIVKVPC